MKKREPDTEYAKLVARPRQTVIIPAKDWDRFEAWLKAPPREIPALRRLARSRPVWEE